MIDSNGNGKSDEFRKVDRKKYDKEFDRIFNKDPDNTESEEEANENAERDFKYNDDWD